MELRQLRYFVTLAEELHFGRAAEREHIVQSALSQQVQRLERELGVRLVDRSTHHVSLTAAGAVFLVEARQILAHADRAAAVARSAVGASAPLRVGIIDSSYDSMPQILHEVQARYPRLVIHQVEVGVPQQYQQLADGRLDVGIGRAELAPPQVSSLLFRQDPLGVLVPSGHRFAGLEGVPVAELATEPLLLAEEARAPEFNQFTVEMCRAAGFTPAVYGGAWRASARPLSWSPRDAACTACPPPASPRCPGPSGGRSPNRLPATHGRCCGVPPRSPDTCTPSSAAPRRCQNGSAGSTPRVRQPNKQSDTAPRFVRRKEISHYPERPLCYGLSRPGCPAALADRCPVWGDAGLQRCQFAWVTQAGAR
jgi:DNA-binding transcriptional LysR family regulator